MMVKNQETHKIIFNIRKSRKLGAKDFFNAFKNMPSNFKDSFIGAEYKRHEILPSSVFKPKIDVNTLTYTDILPNPLRS
jgi:hypothetical protein